MRGRPTSLTRRILPAAERPLPDHFHRLQVRIVARDLRHHDVSSRQSGRQIPARLLRFGIAVVEVDYAERVRVEPSGLERGAIVTD